MYTLYMAEYNDKKKIIEHYDLISPFYHSLWGKHLHHGYWKTGRETKEEAQLALTDHLARSIKIKKGDAILDIGCGFGASSIHLAEKYGAQTTGITISSVQVGIAGEAARHAHVNSKFILMDAEAMDFSEPFDVIWSIESISHYKNKSLFFQKATQLLRPGGSIALIDWFKKENISTTEYKKSILPIEKGMLVELHTMFDYVSMLESNGIEIIKTEDLSRETAKTWDIALEVIKNKMFWKLALKNGKSFIEFLRSFMAMKNGFSSGKFVYGMIVGKKK